MKNTGVELIAEERLAQHSREGYSVEWDDSHVNDELAAAAVCYAAPCRIYKSYSTADGSSINFADPWPWSPECDKRDKHSPIRRLVIAGALIAAEVDRLNRIDTSEQ